MTTTTPMVSVRGVHKFFGDLHVLRGIDLDIASGEVCVILEHVQAAQERRLARTRGAKDDAPALPEHARGH